MARCGAGTAGGSRTSTPISALRAGRSSRQHVGPASAPAFATLADVVESVPEPRVAAHDLFDTDPETRVRHARGQSLPDLLDLRFGRLEAVPDAVARPAASVRGPRDPRPRPVHRHAAHPVRRRHERRGRGQRPAIGRSAGHGRPVATHRRHRARRAERPRDGGRRDDRAGARRGARAARPDRRARAPVVRARDRRRLGRGPRLRDAQPRPRADRAAVRGRRPRGASGHARAAAVPRVRGRPGPPPARPRLGGAARVPHRRRPARDPAPRRRPVRRLGDARLGRGPRGCPRPRPVPAGTVDAPPLDRRRDARAPRVRRQAAPAPRARGVPPGATAAGRLVPAPRRGERLAADGEGDPGGGRRDARQARRREAARVRRRLVPRPAALAVPAQRADRGGLRRGDARDRDRLGARAGAPRPARAGDRLGARGSRRAGPRVHPPVARLPVGLEPVRDLPVPARGGPGRGAGPGRGDQAGRLGHDRRRGRDDQPPPRRRRRPRAVPRRGEGRARDGGARGGRPDVRPRRDHEPGRVAARAAASSAGLPT